MFIWIGIASFVTASTAQASLKTYAIEGELIQKSPDRIIVKTPEGTREFSSSGSKMEGVENVKSGDAVSVRYSLQAVEIKLNAQQPGSMGNEADPDQDGIPGVIDDRGFYAA